MDDEITIGDIILAIVVTITLYWGVSFALNPLFEISFGAIVGLISLVSWIFIGLALIAFLIAFIYMNIYWNRGENISWVYAQLLSLGKRKR